MGQTLLGAAVGCGAGHAEAVGPRFAIGRSGRSATAVNSSTLLGVGLERAHAMEAPWHGGRPWCRFGWTAVLPATSADKGRAWVAREPERRGLNPSALALAKLRGTQSLASALLSRRLWAAACTCHPRAPRGTRRPPVATARAVSAPPRVRSGPSRRRSVPPATLHRRHRLNAVRALARPRAPVGTDTADRDVGEATRCSPVGSLRERSCGPDRADGKSPTPIGPQPTRSRISKASPLLSTGRHPSLAEVGARPIRSGVGNFIAFLLGIITALLTRRPKARESGRADTGEGSRRSLHERRIGLWSPGVSRQPSPPDTRSTPIRYPSSTRAHSHRCNRPRNLGQTDGVPLTITEGVQAGR